MDKKTIALLSYITLIGWLIAFFSYKSSEKSSLPSYHLRQGFGLFLTGFALGIVTWVLSIIIAMISVSLLSIMSIVNLVISLGLLALMIIGAITANKGEEKPLPIIGKMFEGKFNFIP